jgi:hypothetical protein
MTPGLQELSRRDTEKLSAYLDGELAPKEAERLEARLQQQPPLRRALRELQQTSRLLASLPQARVPRSFALSPEMVGQGERGRRYPVLQLATALAAFAFLLVIGFDAFTSNNLPVSFRDQRMAAEAPAAQEAPAEAMLEADDQLDLEEAPAGESQPSQAQPTREGALEESSANEPAAEEEAMAAEIQGTPLPQAGLTAATTSAQDEALGEQDRAAAPSPTATLAPSPEPAPTELAFATGQSPEPGGAARLWLRWVEIGLAALVIVLAGLTFRLRPR